MRWARSVSSALVGAFIQRNRTDPSGRSTYTPSRNSTAIEGIARDAGNVRWYLVEETQLRQVDDERTVVVVSDEAKNDEDDNCRIRDQSIHLFGIPEQ